MKKHVKISTNPQQKEMLNAALNSPENEKLDLYKAVFGGKEPICSGFVAYANTAFSETIIIPPKA